MFSQLGLLSLNQVERNILGSENFGIMGPNFLASFFELHDVQRMPSDRDRSARVGGSNQVLEKDTLGFANRLAAHRAIAKTRRAALANTPMAARDEGHGCLLFEANHAIGPGAAASSPISSIGSILIVWLPRLVSSRYALTKIRLISCMSCLHIGHVESEGPQLAQTHL